MTADGLRGVPRLGIIIADGQPFNRHTPWGNSPGTNGRESHPETEVNRRGSRLFLGKDGRYVWYDTY